MFLWASASAAALPATPPPMTATRRGCAICRRRHWRALQGRQRRQRRRRRRRRAAAPCTAPTCSPASPLIPSSDPPGAHLAPCSSASRRRECQAPAAGQVEAPGREPPGPLHVGARSAIQRVGRLGCWAWRQGTNPDWQMRARGPVPKRAAASQHCRIAVSSSQAPAGCAQLLPPPRHVLLRSQTPHCRVGLFEWIDGSAMRVGKQAMAAGPTPPALRPALQVAFRQPGAFPAAHSQQHQHGGAGGADGGAERGRRRACRRRRGRQAQEGEEAQG